MKKIILVCAILMVLVILVSACSAGIKDGYYDGSMSTPPPGADRDDNDDNTENGNIKIPAGQLTAAEWSDKEHYDSWLKKCGYDENQEKGIFFQTANNAGWDLPWADLYSINITDEENKPVEGVKLSLIRRNSDESTTLFSAVSDAKGNVSLFAKISDQSDILLIAEYDDKETTVSWSGEREQKIVLNDVNKKNNVIEIMFVIDTTGSMSDELNYLQAEIDDVIGRVKDVLDNVTIRIALLFYRDYTDAYVTRYFDFNENIDVVKKNLNDQNADGGGDFPEAVHIALSEAVEKQWSSGNVTKLLFHVLDAPPHDNDSVMFKNALYSAAEQGIRIIPVASSGIDKATEYLLRMEALLTGGTYTFLTDDSGIGNGHIKPDVDEEYVVELLNSMLVRLIKEYYTGEDIEPIYWRQEVQNQQ